MGNLDEWKDKKVKELISRPRNEISKEEIERHQLFSSLLFAITAHYFNGNKYGDDHTYPLNPTSSNTNAYYGHNIAAIAVNKKGEVIDFEFNHNAIFNSSVEHAESRLIRRVFSLVQVYDSWNDEPDGPDKKYSNMLSEVTVYTTLESCTQCTGIMTLGDVKKVVYLQIDPGMYAIGNIVKNLTDGQGFIEAPLPISGDEIDFSLYNDLNAAFQKFESDQSNKVGKPFMIKSDGTEKYTSSITSFLCTQAAYDVFEQGYNRLTKSKLTYPGYSPIDDSKSNAEVQKECLDFYEYAVKKGRRATPHRM